MEKDSHHTKCVVVALLRTIEKSSIEIHKVLNIRGFGVVLLCILLFVHDVDRLNPIREHLIT